MAPEIHKAPRRWIIISLAVVILGLISIGTAAYTVTVAQRSDEQQAEILALKVKAKATEQLRASERRAAKLRAQSECRSSKKTTRQTRTIIEDLRATYLELAANSINPANVAILRRRAKHLPMFKVPHCYPGPKDS